MAEVFRRTSITLPKELHDKGLRIAKKRRRNFSNYIADLIAADAGEAILKRASGAFKTAKSKALKVGVAKTEIVEERPVG